MMQDVDARQAVLRLVDVAIFSLDLVQLSVVRGSYAMGHIALMSMSKHSQSLRDTGRSD
jgi:hypothetical protein